MLLSWSCPNVATDPNFPAQVETVAKTGVEMEALTVVQVGLLTIYDMCKPADRGLVMTDVRVLEKYGGKSGDWHAAVEVRSATRVNPSQAHK